MTATELNASTVSDLTKIEHDVYVALLGHLGGRLSVPAGEFQHVLHSMNLNFGTPIVDKLLLMCKISRDGSVTLNDLAGAVEDACGKEKAISPKMKMHRGVAQPSPRSAVTDMRGMDQSEKVHKLAKEIHLLFQEHDSGSMTMDDFRANLAKLGIRETHETRRILRQTPILFRELIHSLTQTVIDHPVSSMPTSRTPDAYLTTNINLFGHYDGERFTHKGRGEHKSAEQAMNDSDVITWNKKVPKGDVRARKGRGVYRQNFAESHFAIRMDGKALPPLYSSDVAEMMRETDDHHFETTTQKTLAEGLTKSDPIPITSAGYHTKDHGLLREQIYAALRHLDHESITVADFRQRMRNFLGQDLPPQAQRYLNKFEREGRVDFNGFARSFEEYLNIHTQHVPLLPMPAGKTTRSRTPSLIRHHKGHHVNAVAAGNHGDIITWHATESNERAPRHHSEVSFEKKVKFAFDESKRENILSWCQGTCDERFDPETHHKRHLAHTALRDTGPEMLRWQERTAGAAHEDAPIFHTATRLGRESHIARQHKGRACPYGTTRDQGHPNLQGIRQVVGSRKAPVGPRSRPTGRWFNQTTKFDDPADVHYAKRFLNAAGAQKDHLCVGMVVPKDERRHPGKKHFRGGVDGRDHLVGGGVDIAAP